MLNPMVSLLLLFAFVIPHVFAAKVTIRANWGIKPRKWKVTEFTDSVGDAECDLIVRFFKKATRKYMAERIRPFNQNPKVLIEFDGPYAGEEPGQEPGGELDQMFKDAQTVWEKTVAERNWKEIAYNVSVAVHTPKSTPAPSPGRSGKISTKGHN